MAFVLDSATRYSHFSFSEEPDKLEATEIRSSHTSYELRKSQMPDVNVGLWSAKNSWDGTEAPAWLRLVFIRTRQPWEFDILKSSLDILLKNFELEEAYRYSFIPPSVFALMPIHQTEHSNTLTFSLGMTGFFGIAWKHNTRSRKTEGIVGGEEWILETMRGIMNKKKEWARHPLFLALVASVVVGNSLDEGLYTENCNINAVEARTRYHGFIVDSAEIAQGDYTSLSQRMSGCAGVLAFLERTHRVLNDILIDISLYTQRYDVRDDPSSRKVRLEVEDCVETLRRKLKMQKIQLVFFTRRVEIQLTALFHLISQQEAKVGIAVAEDSRTLASASKEDSTAMKTIAAVTIVFLPGTSVAALFAMPLFQWDAVGDSKIVSNRFWIYWAVTVPLTFLTLLFWVLWTKRQARMHRSSEKRAREELWSDIEREMGDEAEKKEV